MIFDITHGQFQQPDVYKTVAAQFSKKYCDFELATLGFLNDSAVVLEISPPIETPEYEPKPCSKRKHLFSFDFNGGKMTPLPADYKVTEYARKELPAKETKEKLILT